RPARSPRWPSRRSSDLLGGTLGGSAMAARRAAVRQPGEPDDIGHFFLALNPDAFRDSGSFEAEVDDVIDTLHDTSPVDPARPVLDRKSTRLNSSHVKSS